jgi:ribonuclease HII
MKSFPSLQREKYYWNLGHEWVIGVDEVGRGCLAGPVVAAAYAIHKKTRRIAEVNDSKLVSAAKRVLLEPVLKKAAKAFGLGSSSVEEINSIGIEKAIFLAMERAILKIPSLEVLLIDGSRIPKFHSLSNHKIETIIKGDRLSYSIAAASIIAKVYRDQYLKQLANEYPMYSWEKNVGYGTTLHRQGILKHGTCPHHRNLFCRNLQS